jgi:hypothetical protein
MSRKVCVMSSFNEDDDYCYMSYDNEFHDGFSDNSSSYFGNCESESYPQDEDESDCETISETISEKHFKDEAAEIIRDIIMYPSCEYDFVSASKDDRKHTHVAITNGNNRFREIVFGQVTIPYYKLPLTFWEKKCYVASGHKISFCINCGLVLPTFHKNKTCRTCVNYVENLDYIEDTEEDEDEDEDEEVEAEADFFN